VTEGAPVWTSLSFFPGRALTAEELDAMHSAAKKQMHRPKKAARIWKALVVFLRRALP